jgi:Na+/H+ antiporter NhaC
MGPLGLLQGTLIYTGTRLMNIFLWIQESYGIPPLVAGMVVCGLAIFGGMISIVFLTILTTPRMKND